MAIASRTPSPGEARRAWADYIEDTAAWREWQAEKYPDDERNVAASRSLARLASYVSELDDEEAGLLVRMMVRANAGDTDHYGPGPLVAQAISRYGFDGHKSEQDHGDFLRQLEALSRTDAATFEADALPD